MPSDLIKIIRDKFSSSSYDIAGYREKMNEIIEQAYRTRFPFAAVFKKKQTKRISSGITSVVEPAGFQQDDGSMIVDSETFFNWCWDKLENGGVVLKAFHKDYSDDKQLKGYIEISLENLFKTKANELTPGLTGRLKQINRILPEICETQPDKKKKIIWLKEIDPEHKTLASFDFLMESARKFQRPEPKYPRKKDAKRGPSINDNEMKTYLERVLREAGGVSTRNNIISFVTHIYNIKPAMGVETEAIEETNQESFETSEYCLGFDHKWMAEDIFSKMTNDMKTLYNLLYIQESKIEDIARIMKSSLGTVENRKKEIEDFMKQHLFPEDFDADYEEAKAVLDIIEDFFHIDEKATALLNQMEFPEGGIPGAIDPDISNESPDSCDEIAIKVTIAKRAGKMLNAIKIAETAVKEMDNEMARYLYLCRVLNLSQKAILQRMTLGRTELTRIKQKANRTLDKLYRKVDEPALAEDALARVLSRMEEKP